METRRQASAWKRFFDLAVSFAALLVSAPLLGLIAVAIRVSSRGPALFLQERIGWHGRRFVIIKFRSMVDHAPYLRNPDGSAYSSDSDARVTRLGKILRRTSLDELPQLLNVIRGEMSLVGPRPHAVNMRTAEKLSHEIVPTYAHRHCVKPGITGWAQINGHRGALEAEEQLVNRVTYDMDYISRWSVGFDIAILFKTIFHVVDTKNAF